MLTRLEYEYNINDLELFFGVPKEKLLEFEKRQEEKKEKSRARERIYRRTKRASMTLEQRVEFNKKNCIKLRKWRANMTPEQYEEYKRKQRDYYHNRIANMTLEELEKFRVETIERVNKYRANMTFEQREEYKRKRREYMRLRRQRQKELKNNDSN